MNEHSRILERERLDIDEDRGPAMLSCTGTQSFRQRLSFCLVSTLRGRRSQ